MVFFSPCDLYVYRRVFFQGTVTVQPPHPMGSWKPHRLPKKLAIEVWNSKTEVGSSFRGDQLLGLVVEPGRFSKYARGQMGSFSESFGDEHKTWFELPPPRNRKNKSNTPFGSLRCVFWINGDPGFGIVTIHPTPPPKFLTATPQKTNMSPKKGLFQYGIHLPTIDFQGTC